jgi:hypothetical protein
MQTLRFVSLFLKLKGKPLSFGSDFLICYVSSQGAAYRGLLKQ